MRTTPETDEIEEAYQQQRESVGGIIEHARELERELTELRKLLDQSLEYLEEHNDEGSIYSGWKSKNLLSLISKIEEKTK